MLSPMIAAAAPTAITATMSSLPLLAAIAPVSTAISPGAIGIPQPVSITTIKKISGKPMFAVTVKIEASSMVAPQQLEATCLLPL
jgi:hypothetical protein